MKALSIRQPWASLIASGRKTIETRVWRTHYRGDLLVCSSSFFPHPSELGHPDQSLPRGQAICLVDVVDCRPMTEQDAEAACIALYPDAWAWLLGNVRPVQPFPVRGQVKFFDVPDHLIQTISIPANSPA